MIVIGVTGGVGTGKSTVAKMFGRLGARVLDADQMTHALMRPKTPVWRKIRRAFGPSVVAENGRMDRRSLGAIVFSDPKKLRRLCGIIHPAVRAKMLREIRKIRRQGPRGVVVLDIPLLMEAAGAYPLDAAVVVVTPLPAAARRLKDRAGWSESEVRRRQRFQMPLREKERLADFVVRNDGSLQNTRRQVARIWKTILGARIHPGTPHRRTDHG